METKHSNDRKFMRMFVSILSIFMIVAIAFQATGNAYAQDNDDPAPFFAVSLTQHWFMVNYFLPETLVTISVYDSQSFSTLVLELNRATDASGNLWIEGWEHNWDLEPGNYVVVTDGTTTKTLLLEYVTLDVFNPKKDLIAGKALPGREVAIGVGNAEGEQWMTVFAHETTGAWKSDFSIIGYDITEDMWAGAHVSDEDGDVTAAHNSGPPSPPLGARFTVFPEWEWFDGWDWPDGATIYITVDGKPECSTQKESWGFFFNGSFGESCDVEVGDIVTFTDGTTVREHTVRNLSITDVNKITNTVAGTADPDTILHVWPHEYNELSLTTDKNGGWKADFDAIGIDLVEGMGGRAEIRDDDGNATAVDWWIGNPRLIAFPAVEQVFAYYWPENSKVKLTINSPSEFMQKERVQPSPWDASDILALFDFGEKYNLKPGDVLMLSGSQMELSYTVRNLTVEEVNHINNTVSGKADAGAEIMVYPFEFGDRPLHVVADKNGDWFADFEKAGIDLVPGMCGRSDIFDEYTNSTTVDWCIPNPTFVAYMPVTIVGYGWTIGDNIVININEGEYTSQAIAGNAEWDPTVVLFELWRDEFLMEAGDHIVMTDEETGVSKDVWVSNLAVSDFDLNAKTVSGTYDPAYDLWVWLYDREGQVPAMDPDSGTWVATFSELAPGTWGGATQWDADGDGTSIDFQVPNPRIIAHPDQEWVEGWGFHNGSEVVLTILDSVNNLLYQGTMVSAPPDWDPGNLEAFVRFDVGYDLKVGDYLWMTDNAFTKDMVVTPLMPIGVDPGGQEIYGVAEPKSEVTIEHDGQMWAVTANGKGNWSANLPTLVRESDALASQWDSDGDMTRIAIHIPSTRFTVWPEYNYLEGYEWPNGAVVSIKVAGKKVCSTEAIASYPEWDQRNTFFWLNFPDGCVVGAGDFITLSSKGLSLTHQVQQLAITEVNIESDTVMGTAVFDPELYTFHTWLHEIEGSYMQLSAENGIWVADFGSQRFDLQPGMGGRVELVDQASNATAVEWHILPIE